MKNSIAVLAFLVTGFASAQKSQVFEIKVQPQKKYTLESTTLNNMNMDVPGQGPMNIMQDTKSPMTITASKADASGKIPAEIKYGDVVVKQMVGGQNQEQKSPVSNMTVTGSFDADGKFTMTDVKGENVTEEVKGTLNIALESGLKHINFPKTALKVGDTFDDTTPLKIPLGQLGTMNATIKTNYKLTKIENGIGYFDTVQTMTLDGDMKDINMKATGSGAGKVEVSIADKYLKKNSTTMDMDMEIEAAPGMMLTVKSKATNSTVATVSKI
ncbi:hypothetical protein [Flavobacterium sp.]|uniref:hypothetical protein n=1 Tax=Flavobacterium sp. TaxID=239 RepID=UPI00121B3906|nr:hypothetical protein [Flavobacterium sp.]RZJ73215.1 MAG: hypothetical protein EOO49_02595 [Flavobacterium sp.]